MRVKLKNRALLKVSGHDARNFLQSQFSNDIFKITKSDVQLNCYCQHQGKIISIMWLFLKDDNYYISIPIEVKDIVQSKLNMYKLSSQVTIEDCSSNFLQYGQINQIDKHSYVINKNLSLMLSKEIIPSNIDLNVWERYCIEQKLPEIYLNSVERYIPQDLNLDIDNFGVSFSKGCYPGQEVVARMHYLGTPKRRLFSFISKFEAFIGDNIDIENSDSLKSSGKVIRISKVDSKFYLLGTFEVKHANKDIFLNGDINKKLTIINEKSNLS